MASDLPSCYLYCPEFSIVVCKDHAQAIPQSQLGRHLMEHHLYTSHLLEAEHVMEAVGALELETIPRVHYKIRSRGLIPRIHGLEVSTRVLCDVCHEVFVSEEKALRHVRERHHVAFKKYQRDRISSCLAQSLLPNRYFFRVDGPEDTQHSAGGTQAGSPMSQNHWSVRSDSDGSSEEGSVDERDNPDSEETHDGPKRRVRNPNRTIGGSGPRSERTGEASRSKTPRVTSPPAALPDNMVDDLLSRNSVAQNSADAEPMVLLSGSRDELSGFHQQTRYPELLNGRNLNHLRDLFVLDLGDSTETADSYIGSCMQYIFAKGTKTISLVPRHIRCLLSSFDREHTTLRPLKPVQERSSEEKYRRIFKSFLIFLYRSLPYQPGGPEAKTRAAKSVQNLYCVDDKTRDIIEEISMFLASQMLQDAAENTDSEDARPDRCRKAVQQRTSQLDVEFETEDEEEEPDIDFAPSEDPDITSLLQSLREPSRSAAAALKRQKFSFPLQLVQEGAAMVENLLVALATSPLNVTLPSPIYAFFALASVNYDIQRLRRVDQISGRYSAFIYTMQLIVLDVHWTNWVGELEASDNALAYAEKHPFEDSIRPWLSDFFKHQSPYPLGELLSFRAYALHYNALASSMGNEVLELGRHHLQYGDVDLSQEDLQGFFRKAILDVAQYLLGTLMFWEGRGVFGNISLDDAAATENFVEDKNGFNFLSKNNTLRPYQGYLVRKTAEDRELSKKWLKVKAGRLEIVSFQAELYLQQVRKFLVKLLVLVHMASGAPARGTEIIPILVSNTVISRRNLFMDPKTKLFLIRLSYSKVLSTTGTERNAVRALPQSLSHVLLVYLVVVEPFVYFLHCSLDIKNRRNLLFSVGGGLITSRQLSQGMGGLAKSLMGKALSVRSWRHLSQGFIRYGLGKDLTGDSIDVPEISELDIESLAAGQAHHSARTAMLVYGRPQVQFSNLPVNQQKAFTEFSQEWHAYIGVGSEFELPRYLYSPTDLEVDFPNRGLRTRQENSTSSQGTPFNFEQPCLKVSWKHASTTAVTPRFIPAGLFHSFIGMCRPEYYWLTRVSHGEPADHTGSVEDVDELQQVRLPPRYSSSRATKKGTAGQDLLLLVLKEFLGDSQAEFRNPGQRSMLYHLLTHQPYLVCILPTAGGKTTLFLLAASLAWSKTTVIVAPLVALKLNLLRKLQLLGLDFCVWEDSSRKAITVSPPSVILLSIESTVNSSFTDWGKAMAKSGQLERIIFDEAHLVPTAASYRGVMSNANRITQIPVPLVFASATLSTRLLNELTEMVRIPSSVPLVVRSDINRPNIKYVVKDTGRLGDNKEFGYVMDFVADARRTKKISPNAKVIIFFNQVNQVLEFGQRYNDEVAFLHGKTPDLEKESQIRCFENREKLILAGTSAISEGSDFEDVSLVIHVGVRWGMSEYLQASGRAARKAGTTGWSYVLIPPWARKGLHYHKDEEQKVFHHFLLDGVCRRRLIHREYNGKLVDHCAEGEESCDLSAKTGRIPSTA